MVPHSRASGPFLTQEVVRDEGNRDDLRRVSGSAARAVPRRQLVRLPTPPAATPAAGHRRGRRIAHITHVYRLWPDPDPTPLDDAALTALYEPTGPGLRVNFVTSVDGAVEVEGLSKGLQNPADNRVFGLLRQFPDALLVGAGTLRQEGRRAVRLDSPRRARAGGGGALHPPRRAVCRRPPSRVPSPTRPPGPPTRPDGRPPVAAVMVENVRETGSSESPQEHPEFSRSVDARVDAPARGDGLVGSQATARLEAEAASRTEFAKAMSDRSHTVPVDAGAS